MSVDGVAHVLERGRRRGARDPASFDPHWGKVCDFLSGRAGRRVSADLGDAAEGLQELGYLYDANELMLPLPPTSSRD